MYECFTDRARKVIQLANQEAQRFNNHEYIGTEHILLGLVKEGSGVAANVLKNLDIDLRQIRLEVEKIDQPGPDMATMDKLPQTPKAKKVIEYSIEEARNLNHNYVGTEHLLLGLLREGEGVAAQILMNLGLKLQDVREEVLNLLGPNMERTVSQGAVSWSPEAEVQDFPPAVREAWMELEAQIGQLNQEKELALAEQDFEKAAHLRDQADKLRLKQKLIRGQWLTRFTIDPSWLFWNSAAVRKLARVIRAERRWEQLPSLADALQEAGCTDKEMLDHCRQPREHTHCCWVIDLLLANV